MSTVSCSCSQTISSSENEEWSCSEECDFAGYEYLSSESSQGSIDIDSDCEATMSQNDDWEVDQFSENQAEQRIHRQSQQHANLVSEDSILSKTSWTDEKHGLYLNSIEEAFVKTLYERGHYMYSCKRWESERITTSVSGKGLYEPFNLIPHENNTKAQIRCNDEEIQNRTKRSRLERICIKQAQQQEDIDGRVYTCKSLNVQAGEGSRETGDTPNEYSPKSQMQCFKSDTSKHDNGRNKDISNRYVQEDQVVPSVKNAAQSSS